MARLRACYLWRSENASAAKIIRRRRSLARSGSLRRSGAAPPPAHQPALRANDMPDAESRKSVTLSREELYALVWATPMSRLTAKYGLSGNGLAKICRRLDVPYPPRGYWARKEAVKKVTQAALPGIRPGTRSQVTIASSPPASSQRSTPLSRASMAGCGTNCRTRRCSPQQPGPESYSDVGGPTTTMRDLTRSSDGRHHRSSRSPSPRGQIGGNQGAGAKSGLDKTWGQGHLRQALSLPKYFWVLSGVFSPQTNSTYGSI
jgi:hypothetical protein